MSLIETTKLLTFCSNVSTSAQFLEDDVIKDWKTLQFLLLNTNITLISFDLRIECHVGFQSIDFCNLTTKVEITLNCFWYFVANFIGNQEISNDTSKLDVTIKIRYYFASSELCANIQLYCKITIKRKQKINLQFIKIFYIHSCSTVTLRRTTINLIQLCIVQFQKASQKQEIDFLFSLIV